MSFDGKVVIFNEKSKKLCGSLGIVGHECLQHHCSVMVGEGFWDIVICDKDVLNIIGDFESAKEIREEQARKVKKKFLKWLNTFVHNTMYPYSSCEIAKMEEAFNQGYKLSLKEGG